MTTRKQVRDGWLAIALALSLAACSGQELYRDIDEAEANDMVSALSRAGIASEKVAGDKGVFAVEVAPSDFSRAVDVLRENGLPRENFESLGTVFKKEGFTSSSLAERARLVFGLSQELSNTISQFDGVVDARVHLAMPEADAMTGVANPPSASVFVKYREGFDLRSQTAAIKALVTNSVEGLDYDKVSIAMTEVKPLPAAQPPALADRFAEILFVVASVLGGVLLALGGWRWWATRQRKPAGKDVTAVRGEATHG